MKKIYLIGGTMGVGKTTVCQQLKKIYLKVFSLMVIGVGIQAHFKLLKRQN